MRPVDRFVTSAPVVLHEIPELASARERRLSREAEAFPASARASTVPASTAVFLMGLRAREDRPSGPWSRVRPTADNRSVVSNDLPVLFERIRGCLDEPESDFVLKDLEHTLTDGYARALALEAERTRVEREIGELARGIDDPVRIGELRDLAERRTRADADLARLRALLELLRQRVAARRAVLSS